MRRHLTTPVATSADLALVLASTPTSIAGTTAVVTATVTNGGPSDAPGTVVTITLPPGTSYNTATLPSGWFAVDNGDGTVTLTTTNVLTRGCIGGAAGDGEHGVERDAGDEPGIPGRGGQQRRRTRTRRNNSGNSDTSVVSAATLSISKTSSPATVNAGEW